MSFNSVKDAISDLRKGKLIVVVDSEDRENEGDLVGIASTITSEQVNFMIKQGGGLLCVAMEKSRLQELELPHMVEQNQENQRTQFTISVDAIDTHTGISAIERAHTINLLANPHISKEKFVRPGHVFPIQSHEGGISMRHGHTESAVALAHWAGFFPAGVICEILNSDGSMARKQELLEFSKQYNLKIITVESIISYLENLKDLKNFSSINTDSKIKLNNK